MSYPHDDGCQEQEDNNWRACYAAASRAGYSLDEADKCHDGDLQCPSCPWRRCALCGGNAGTLNEEGTHNLCRARARHGSPTPSLGDKCSVCHGSKHDSKLKSGQAGPCLDANLGPARIKRAIDALFPPCPHCGGTGVEPGSC